MNKVRLSRKVIMSGNLVWFFRDIKIGDEVVTHGRRWRRTPDASLVTRNMPYMTESSANRLQNLLNESVVWADFDVEHGRMSFSYDFGKVIRYVYEKVEDAFVCVCGCEREFDPACNCLCHVLAERESRHKCGECDDSCTCKCHAQRHLHLLARDCCKCACHVKPYYFGCPSCGKGECDCGCDCGDKHMPEFDADDPYMCQCQCHIKPYKYMPDCGCECAGQGTGM